MNSKNILLIDDEKYVSLVVQTCLQKLAGWQVSIANSGQEGILKAEAELPDAILLDMMMPEIDGRMVLQQLRKNPPTTIIPVILLTAKVDPVAKNEYAQLEITGVLAKPFEPFHLVSEIARLLNWDYSPYLKT